MSRGVAKLSLGPLPRADLVKITVSLPVELKAQLEAYAEVYGQLHGAVDVAALIPHMLAAFVARDRGFKAAVRRASSGREALVASTLN